VIVNGIVGLHATGGSTNHTIHLLAMASAAGIAITWNDLADVAEVVPLLARIYPNGNADVNHFHAAGGMGFLIRELLGAGLLHADVQTVWGHGPRRLGSSNRASVRTGALVWREAAKVSGDLAVLRPASDPFQATGGLRVLSGNLGRAVMKTSAVAVGAPRDRGTGARVRFAGRIAARLQGRRTDPATSWPSSASRDPKANGMPELHKLLPPLAVLQDRGQRVALVTDGRMSGASGKVPAAIHVTPGSRLTAARSRNCAMATSCASTPWPACWRRRFEAGEWAGAARRSRSMPHPAGEGVGRELFGLMRANAGTAEEGACSLFVRA
jgi:phosphogluconate dehydratase